MGLLRSCHITLIHSSSQTDLSLHPALHTQHILITLLKVFQMYYEKQTKELFYFFSLQSRTKRCVTADHHLAFPWMLPLSLFCSHFYLDYFYSSFLSDTSFFPQLLFLLHLPRTKQLFHSTYKHHTITCIFNSQGQNA